MTFAEVAEYAKRAHVSLDTALAVLEKVDLGGRPLAEGYVGARARRVLRDARDRVGAIRTLLEQIGGREGK